MDFPRRRGRGHRFRSAEDPGRAMPGRCPDSSRLDRWRSRRTDRPRPCPGPAEVIRPQSRRQGLGRDGPSIPGPSSSDMVADRPAGNIIVTTARKRHKISRRGEYDECEICHAQRYKRSLKVRGKWITGMGRWRPSADCPGYNPAQWEMVNGALRKIEWERINGELRQIEWERLTEN